MLIGIFAPRHSHAMEIAAFKDVFSEANRQIDQKAFYEILVYSIDLDPIRCASGLRILPDRTIHDQDESIDTLAIVGTLDIPARATPRLNASLRRHALAARRYGAACTGTFLLGAAGLLDGKRVTTHWAYAPELAAAFPSAIVDPDRIFVRDGPMFTAAGVTASIDLALALVEEDLGHAVALAVARRLVMFLKRPGGQSQLSVHLAAQIASRSAIQDVQQWILDRPTADHSVGKLARRAGMSERNFARVFRAQTGITPADFVQATRLEAARRLLEDTDLPLKRVASACGFRGDNAMRRAFSKRLGIAPRDYRTHSYLTQLGRPAASA